jgi:replication-associated recombination protein RarA
MQLTEQYRPQTWGDVVGQDKVVSKIQQLKIRGLGGRAYWISGASGTGKTTIGKLIAAEVADEFNCTEVNSTTLTPAGADKLERNSLTLGMGAKTGKAIIVNEAHGLRGETITVLLDWLERLPAHVIVIFTTTIEGQTSLFADCDDTAPLLSRCVELTLARRDLSKPFAERARQIAMAEGLDGKTIEVYVKLAQRCKNNLRAMIQKIDAGELAE